MSPAVLQYRYILQVQVPGSTVLRIQYIPFQVISVCVSEREREQIEKSRGDRELT